MSAPNTHGLPTLPPANAKPKPFNRNPQFCDKVKAWIGRYKLDTVVETGTWLGKTTEWLASHFPTVHTVEMNEERHKLNQDNLGALSNVTAWCGDSARVLPTILTQLPKKSRVLFYLDAHWGKSCPLLGELEAIAQVPWLHNNCMIVIDDFKVPGRPDVPYDSIKGHPFDLKYVQGKLKKIMRPLDVAYYAPPKKLARSRGKLVVIPHSWNRRVVQKK